MNCTKCGAFIPEKRHEMGFTVCVNCSTQPKWSGHLVVHHKTGNEYEVIKDQETAQILKKLSTRNGFSSARKGATAHPTISKNGGRVYDAPSQNIPETRVILGRKPADSSKWRDEVHGPMLLSMYETSPTEAKKKLEEIFQSGELSPTCRKQLLLIFSSK